MPYRISQIVKWDVDDPEVWTKTETRYKGGPDNDSESYEVKKEVTKYKVHAKVKVPKHLCRQYGGWLYNLVALFSLGIIPVIEHLLVEREKTSSRALTNFGLDPVDFEKRKARNEEREAEGGKYSHLQPADADYARTMDLVSGIFCLPCSLIFRVPLFPVYLIILVCKVLCCSTTPWPFSPFTANLWYEFVFEYDTTSEEPWTITQVGGIDHGYFDPESPRTSRWDPGSEPGEEFEIYIPPIFNKCLFL